MKLSMAQVLEAITNPVEPRRGATRGRRRVEELDDDDRTPAPASSEQLHDGFTKKEREAAQAYLRRRAERQHYDPMWQSWMA